MSSDSTPILAMNISLIKHDRFPKLCLSITLLNVTNPEPCVPQLLYDAELTKVMSRQLLEQLEELQTLWARAPDLETFEHVCKEMLKVYAGHVSAKLNFRRHHFKSSVARAPRSARRRTLIVQ